MCKKHEEPSSGRNNPYFPGLREAIFHGRFLSEIPKSRLFYPPSGNLGNLGGLKVHTCAFVIFGLLTRWLAGSEWVMASKMGSRTAWIARREEIGAYVTKTGQKRRDGTFHHNWRDTTGSTVPSVTPIVAAKLNHFQNFFAHTAPTLHYQIYASSTLYLHLDARERFQLARQFLHSAPPSRLGTMISPSNKKQIHCRHDGKICWCRTCNSFMSFHIIS